MPEFMRQADSNGHRPKVDASEVADALHQDVKEARAIPRPGSIDRFYVESQTEEEIEEQKEAYAAKAEEEATAPEKAAAELSYQAKNARKAGDRQDALAEGERRRFETHLSVLGQHRRRRPHAGLVYWIVRVLIILGDLAGASGAILLLGEEPFNAFAQATSVAVSAVVLGVVGATLRHRAAAKARQKPLEDLIDDEKTCSSFFSGPDPSAGKILMLVFIAGVVAIVGGIFALREAAEGQEAAVAFGCFALAVCLASFLNSYEYACEVSDYLETANAWRKEFGKEAAEAGADPVIARHGGAEAEAKSIRARYKAEGEAAGRGLHRKKYEEFRKRPEIYGHGTARGSRKGGGKGGSHGTGAGTKRTS